MISLLAALQSSASATIDFGAVAQTLTAGGVTGLFVFAFKFNNRMTRLETVLLEPDMGVVPRMKGIGNQGHTHASTLQGHAGQLEVHEQRLNDHSKQLDSHDERLDRRSAMQPNDVGLLDRRS